MIVSWVALVQRLQRGRACRRSCFWPAPAVLGLDVDVEARRSPMSESTSRNGALRGRVDSAASSSSATSRRRSGSLACSSTPPPRCRFKAAHAAARATPPRWAGPAGSASSTLSRSSSPPKAGTRRDFSRPTGTQPANHRSSGTSCHRSGSWWGGGRGIEGGRVFGLALGPLGVAVRRLELGRDGTADGSPRFGHLRAMVAHGPRPPLPGGARSAALCSRAVVGRRVGEGMG
jgi:hypothetical protein